LISYTQGNLLDARADALVNAVNTVGVMGKGIALMFKARFPENYHLYAAACKAKHVCTGAMFVTERTATNGPRWIVNFPTKQHWRAPSQMEWIVNGLQDLKQWMITHQIKSIAIPPLGAGLGGLAWPDVRAQIELALGDVEAEVWVFGVAG
jgi:O-acetyl-ADP-ribose deacetylase (regulator of RNase III)